MRVLHSSDWHLGKKLEGYSRIKEQEKFIENLVKIADGESVDIVLIAGDIYDVPSPPVEAEKLFFKGVKALSNNGKRPVVIISGNHDNPEKLGASNPLSSEYGIIVFTTPFEKKETGRYGNFEITKSTRGGIEIEIEKNSEKEKVYIYALPYPGEKALGETFSGTQDEEQISYSKRIGEILTNGILECQREIPKVIMTHIFMTGSICSDNERPIELGGSLAVNLNDMPEVDYIALGHIHKPMVYKDKRAVYSGSPIEYRVSENRYKKKVFIADIKGSLNTEIRGIEIDNYKPIKKYIVSSVEEGIEKSKELLGVDEWIYLEINTHRALKNNEVREIKKNSNIIEIIPNIKLNDDLAEPLENYNEENIDLAFNGFYKKKYNIEPSKEIIKIFQRLVGEVE
ncbi:MAG: exonuclease subunit SbcD [Psychrilyobacter sp.]|nr:exonuclease subunit SbcD [Psychrilyobacter sp.]